MAAPVSSPRESSPMRWSWKIATVAGIQIRVHVTFPLLLVWLFWAGANRGIAQAAEGVAFILAVFGCIVLHEFGHALTGRRFGVITRDITLLPTGGVARLDRIPRHPRQEVTIALAGPLVNVAIASVLLLYMRLAPGVYDFSDPVLFERSFTARLFMVNVFIVAFNLIPAFPMDGGRVLRALLAMRMNYVRATRIATWIGQGLAIVFGIAGVMTELHMLLLVGLFVFLAAGEEYAMVAARVTMGGFPVRA